MNSRMPATEREIARNRAFALWLFAVVVAASLGCISGTWTVEYDEDGSGILRLDATVGTNGESGIEQLKKDLASGGWKDFAVTQDGEYRVRMTGTLPFAAEKTPKTVTQFFKDPKLTIEPAEDGSRLYMWQATYDVGEGDKGGKGWEQFKADIREGKKRETPENSLFYHWFNDPYWPGTKESVERAQKMFEQWPEFCIAVNVKLPGQDPIACEGDWENTAAYMAGQEETARFVMEADAAPRERSGKLLVKRKAGKGVEAVDANPRFNANYDVTAHESDPESARRAAEVAAANRTKRAGAVADGASCLVLRMKVPEAGSGTFEMEGEDDVGGLHPLGSEPWGQDGQQALTVEAVEAGQQPDRGWCVFALYAPPDTLGPGRGPRPVQVKLHFRPAKAGGREFDSTGSFKLIRPPVVLVHGTFDAPASCWDTPGTHSQVTMKTRLEQEALRVFLVDWEETNGKKNPSAFVDNARTVWANPGGIKDAIEALRKDGFAATQADLVCHSQGGVIARMYARGAAREPRGDLDAHFRDPGRCMRDSGCWYHRGDNFARGDIHRLITISTTHMGSDNSRALETFQALSSQPGAADRLDAAVAELLLLFAGYQGNSRTEWVWEMIKRSGHHLTDGVLDQSPGSAALKAIGRSDVPSHAIACTCEDEDMMELNGEYQSRYEQVWSNSTRDLLVASWQRMGQSKDAEDIGRRSDEERTVGMRVEELKAFLGRAEAQTPDVVQARRELQDAEASLAALRKANARRLRAAMFGNCPNDGTVREESSKGDLPEAYTTTLPHVLHGYAPTYSSVQERVVTLLLNDGSLFCKEGFPPAGKLPENREYTGPSSPAPDAGGAADVGDVVVPNVVGMTAAQAKATLINKRLDFAFAPSARRTPDEASEGVVEAQSPAARSRVNRKSTVTLSVYGPYEAAEVERVEVPQVVGLEAGEAFAALKEDFRVQFKAAVGPAPAGREETVERTDPAGGTMAPRNSLVTVYIFPR